MKIVSINIGKVKQYGWKGGTPSAINKQPVSGNIALTSTGLEGDEQANLEAHGGEEKAVLVIPESNYSFLGVQQSTGFLGENLQLSGLTEADVQVGDRLQIGSVLLEVSQPRSPCWKLGEIMNDKAFLKQYSQAGRVGFYCRVLKTGVVKAGAKVERVSSQIPSVAIDALFVAQFERNPSKTQWQMIQKAIDHPALSQAWLSKLTTLQQRANLALTPNL